MSSQRSDWRERLHANPSRMEQELAINLEHDGIVQEYGEHESVDKQFLLVSYKFPEKPNRMFYYRLEHLLTVVSGRRLQKSVIIIPDRALSLIQSLCNEYGGKVFAAKYGGEPVGE